MLPSKYIHMCSPPIISCLQQKGQLPSNKPVLLAIVYNVFIVGLSLHGANHKGAKHLEEVSGVAHATSLLVPR